MVKFLLWTFVDLQWWTVVGWRARASLWGTVSRFVSSISYEMIEMEVSLFSLELLLLVCYCALCPFFEGAAQRKRYKKSLSFSSTLLRVVLVNSHQRWKQTRNRVCFHLWCELTLALWCHSIVSFSLTLLRVAFFVFVVVWRLRRPLQEIAGRELFPKYLCF